MKRQPEPLNGRSRVKVSRRYASGRKNSCQYGKRSVRLQKRARVSLFSAKVALAKRWWQHPSTLGVLVHVAPSLSLIAPKALKTLLKVNCLVMKRVHSRVLTERDKGSWRLLTAARYFWTRSLTCP